MATEYDALEVPTTSAKDTHSKSKTPTEASAIPLLDNCKAVKVLTDWPTSPKPIRSSKVVATWNIIVDAVLFLSAVMFLAFAFIVRYYDQAPTTDHPRATKLLVSATKYGPTIFPITFATILGRATHAILLWRLERGERIGVLDTLASSTSLTATVVSLFQLRAVSVFGLALVSVWILSPIGGQASIRQLDIGAKIQILPSTFDYMVQNGYGQAWQHSDNAQPLDFLRTLFLGAIITPVSVKSTPLDLWGNVKVPRIELYETTTQPDRDGWYKANPGDPRSYPSLVGIPISGISGTQYTDYNLSIHTPYLSLNCSLTYPFAFRTVVDHPPSGYKNVTGTGGYFYYQSRDPPSFTSLKPYNFLYLGVTYIPKDNVLLDCNVTNTYVEAHVKCPRSSTCAVDRLRRSPLDHLPEVWTLLDTYYYTPYILFNQILESSQGRDRYPTLIDRYLSDPDLVVKGDSLYQVNITTEENYTIRLEQLLNSYFTGMNGLYAITGGLNNDTAYYWDQNASFVPKFAYMIGNFTFPDGVYNFTGDGKKARAWTTEGTKSLRTEILIARIPWVITLAVSSSVLILASLVAPLVRFFFTRGPDILMNVSSLVARDNQNIPLPDGGTHLEASDRARLVKDIKVRFGDVQRNMSVGSLVFGTLDTADGQGIARIRKGRMYE